MTTSTESRNDLPAVPTSEGRSIALPFENTYARLDERFYRRMQPTPVRRPQLIQLNDSLARELNLDPDLLRSSAGVAVLAGNQVADGSEPLAQAYAGHQFGSFVPQLGDGRAILLGEAVARNGKRYDVQLKGAGRTPFSRGGDGRAAIGPVLREYLLSEAMTALGVPSTRALAAVATGETVLRETPQPGAVLTRVAASHLRVGTFQFFAVREDADAVRSLADYAIQRHYPEVAGADRPYRAFLEGVVSRQARLVAQWLSLGFIHGVMNTDNTSISGETIDYGPCAFMEAYHAETVFSSIDRNGRYAYRNQPAAMLWNLMRLAEALLPALQTEAGDEAAAISEANAALSTFETVFEAARAELFGKKLGLSSVQEGDDQLLNDLLAQMTASEVDFTSFFRELADAAGDAKPTDAPRQRFADASAFGNWERRWRDRLLREPGNGVDHARQMQKVNPLFIPRNHLVEEALRAAALGDYRPFEQLLAVVSHPYENRPGLEQYAVQARPEEMVRQTFCGT